MPLNKKGKEILKSMKKQYGKEKGIEVFYASKNKGVIDKVEKVKKGGGIKLKRGGSFDYEGEAYGTTPSASYQQTDTGDLGSESANVAANIKATGGAGSGSETKTTGPSRGTVTKAIGAGVSKILDFPVTAVTTTLGALQKSTKQQKATKEARKIDPLGGEMLTTKNMYRPYKPPQTDTGGGDSDQPIKKPLIPKAKPIQPQKQTFNAQSFFPFRAYKSGGVPSGPPPEKGPNSQMPVKMKGGGNMTCPHRPDGIKGIGKAVRGFGFKGTK
tara:strand:- start:6080 stop:6892 length:813 start_codon:yes stop_codon:yes gene_type:complete